jgi:hypothetical protein
MAGDRRRRAPSGNAGDGGAARRTAGAGVGLQEGADATLEHRGTSGVADGEALVGFPACVVDAVSAHIAIHLAVGHAAAERTATGEGAPFPVAALERAGRARAAVSGGVALRSGSRSARREERRPRRDHDRSRGARGHEACTMAETRRRVEWSCGQQTLDLVGLQPELRGFHCDAAAPCSACAAGTCARCCTTCASTSGLSAVGGIRNHPNSHPKVLGVAFATCTGNEDFNPHHRGPFSGYQRHR